MLPMITPAIGSELEATTMNEILKLLISQGTGGILPIVKSLMNQAMKIERNNATITLTALENGIELKSGREFAAYLGPVPKQSSTGGKSKLLGISKRGDKYIRCLLVHGARSVTLANIKIAIHSLQLPYAIY